MQIRTERPPKIKEPMDIGERAKQFAPYAALGSMAAVLDRVVAGRDVGDLVHESDLSDFNYLCAEDIDEINLKEE